MIAKNNIIEADYGTANCRPFFCTFGVGFDAAVSERCARQKRRGMLMYLKNTFNEYINFSPEEYIIEANGQVITDRAFLVVVCNASQYGNNAFVAPEASVTDGELDITIVHAGNVISQAFVGVDMLTGLIGKKHARRYIPHPLGCNPPQEFGRGTSRRRCRRDAYRYRNQMS